MDTLTYEQLRKLTDTNNVNYYNVYNSDQDVLTYFSADYYINNPHDNVNVDQKLNIAFTDIEVYQQDRTVKFDFDGDKYPINAITVYISHLKTYFVFYMLLPMNKSLFDVNYDFKAALIEEQYLTVDDVDIKVNITIYEDEKIMLTDYWSLLKASNVVVTSGYNWDVFDLPYIYRRMIKLFGNKYTVNNIISAFGHVEVDYGKMVKIADYVTLDLLYLYKPRSDGGLNYGKKQATYKLDYVAEQELKIKKKEHKLDLHEWFEKDPLQFLLYNIIDVVLCVKLNDKLKHIELHNIIRKQMGISMNKSLIGSSALFDSFVLTNLLTKHEYVRHGMNIESNKSYTAEVLKNIPIPLTEKKNVISPLDISQKAYTQFTCKFSGAYVKTPTPGITNTGTIIDLDASLPPWEKIFIRRNDRVHWDNIGNYTYLIGDETLTWNDAGETCWRKVLGKVSHPWSKDHGKLLKITTKSGKSITVTDNHSVFGIQKGTICDKYYTLDAKLLKIGDYILGMKKFEPGDGKISHDPELIGFWLSDGWVASKNATYYIAKQDKSKLDIFYPNIDNIRMKRAASDKYKEEWIGKISEPTRTELKDFYISTKKKSFIELLKYSESQRILAWKGMYDADGTVHFGADRIQPTERLCKYRFTETEECFIVAHTIGWKPILTPTGINNSKKYDLDMVAVEVIRSHRGYTGGLSRLKLSGNDRHPYYKLQNEMPWVRNCYTEDIGLETITKIEEIDYEGEVYDLSVEETERFFAGHGLGAHNTSLYPSMIREHNVGFDTYVARVIPPTTYKFIQLLSDHLGIKQLPPILAGNVFKLIMDYVDREEPANKAEARKTWYYITMSLIYKLAESKVTLNDILNPKTDQQCVLLSHYLIPLLDIFNNIHPEFDCYNKVSYDYLFNSNSINGYDHIYIIRNVQETNKYIEKMKPSQLLDFIGKKYIFTITGCVFERHSSKLGLYYQMLNDLGDIRTGYVAEATKYVDNKSSLEYQFYNSREKSIKVVMNSLYGLLGLSSFRYSNHWLAHTVTTSGRLVLKLSQFITEQFLLDKYK